jgi:hypothetical protein
MYRVGGYNGFIKKAKAKHFTLYVEADTPADAVRWVASNHGFSEIGPNGLRINHFVTCGDWRRITAEEVIGVIETVPAKNDPSSWSRRERL